jgi:hypothetical protein
MRPRTLLAIAAAAILFGGCGGSDEDGDGNAAAEPSVEQVRALVRATPGIEKCDRFDAASQRGRRAPDSGEVDDGETYLCGEVGIASYSEFKDQDELDKGIAYGPGRYRNPYFVNGDVLVWVFEPERRSLPRELPEPLLGLPERVRRDCSCGEVVTP